MMKELKELILYCQQLTMKNQQKIEIAEKSCEEILKLKLRFSKVGE